MFYLVDRNEKVKASYTTPKSPHNGFRVIEVPDQLYVDESVSPFDLDELLLQKYQALLASKPQFDHVVYEDLKDALDWDMASSGVRGAVGTGAAWLSEQSGTDAGKLQTTVMDVSSDGAFDEFAVYWDLYSIQRVEVGYRTERHFVREDPDLVNVAISHDNGGSFKAALHMQGVDFTAHDNRLVLRFENFSTNRYYVGGYAILY